MFRIFGNVADFAGLVAHFARIAAFLLDFFRHFAHLLAVIGADRLDGARTMSAGTVSGDRG